MTKNYSINKDLDNFVFFYNFFAYLLITTGTFNYFNRFYTIPSFYDGEGML